MTHFIVAVALCVLLPGVDRIGAFGAAVAGAQVTPEVAATPTITAGNQAAANAEATATPVTNNGAAGNAEMTPTQVSAAAGQPAGTAAVSAAGTEHNELGTDHKTLENPTPVIPPGREALLAPMLGQDATLPGPCKLEDAKVEHSTITTTYTCGSGSVVVQLSHPSQAPAGAVQTAQFAIVLKSGSPPSGFMDALAAHIRSREGDFKWKWVGNVKPNPPSQGTVPMRRSMSIAVAGVLGVAILGWILYRRRPPA